MRPWERKMIAAGNRTKAAAAQCCLNVQMCRGPSLACLLPQRSVSRMLYPCAGSEV